MSSRLQQPDMVRALLFMLIIFPLCLLFFALMYLFHVPFVQRPTTIVRQKSPQNIYRQSAYLMLSPEDIVRERIAVAKTKIANNVSYLHTVFTLGTQADSMLADIYTNDNSYWLGSSLSADTNYLEQEEKNTVNAILANLAVGKENEKTAPNTSLHAYANALTIASSDELIGSDNALLDTIRNDVSRMQESVALASITPSPHQIQGTAFTLHIPILMYHYIRVNPNPSDAIGFGLSVTPTDFETQMSYLATHGYTTITMDDLVHALENRMPISPKSVILTFDDGYDDYYTAALPILEKYHFKSETYVITGFIGQARYMTWGMLQSLTHNPLVTIGSHTIHHLELGALPIQKVDSELIGSKEMLESTLHISIHDFCYPSGSYTYQVEQEVAKAGYRDATTTGFSGYHGFGNYFAMSRVRVNGGENLNDFILNLNQ